MQDPSPKHHTKFEVSVMHVSWKSVMENIDYGRTEGRMDRAKTVYPPLL